MNKDVEVSFDPAGGNEYRASLDVSDIINIINGVGKIEAEAGATHWLSVSGFGTPGQTVTVNLKNAKTTTSNSSNSKLVLAASGRHAGKGAKIIKITVDQGAH